MLECIVNVSEGRDPRVLEALHRAGGAEEDTPTDGDSPTTT